MRVLLGLALVLGCGGSATSEFAHQDPAFTAKVPAALKAGADKRAGESGSVSFANDDRSQEVFFAWARTGSKYDPVPAFQRHRTHPDLAKIVADEKIAAGEFVHIERGARTFTHSVITSGDYGIECTASWATSSPPAAAFRNACRTLTAQ